MGFAVALLSGKDLGNHGGPALFWSIWLWQVAGTWSICPFPGSLCSALMTELQWSPVQNSKTSCLKSSLCSDLEVTNAMLVLKKGSKLARPKREGMIKLLSEQEGTQYNKENNEWDTKESASICFSKGKSGPVKLEGFESLSKLEDKGGLADKVCLN